MANFTDMQIKMRKEVEDNFGDRIVLHEDKQSCHYVNAFIAEALRFRGVAPLGVPHTALCDYKLGIHFLINLSDSQKLIPFLNQLFVQINIIY